MIFPSIRPYEATAVDTRHSHVQVLGRISRPDVHSILLFQHHQQRRCCQQQSKTDRPRIGTLHLFVFSENLYFVSNNLILKKNCVIFLRREVHYRVNVKPHNENYTLEFMQKREWKYIEEMSNGSLDDVVTTLNSVLIVTINNLISIFYVNNYRLFFYYFVCVCFF